MVVTISKLTETVDIYLITSKIDQSYYKIDQSYCNSQNQKIAAKRSYFIDFLLLTHLSRILKRANGVSALFRFSPSW